jgi:dissimilatory sulfite reductase (desulfoviridin) alpha/beta subunit
VSLDPDKAKALKASGILQQSTPELFTVRLRIAGGRVLADRLQGLAAIAAEFGDGEIHVTTRQGIEIPNVPFDRVEAVRECLREVGLEIGTCGPRVRTVTACPGERCRNGLVPAGSLGQELDRRFFGREGLPHKFKVTISGCTNGCTKPSENDFGILGVTTTSLDAAACNGCLACQFACPTNCVTVEQDGEAWTVQREEAGCINCGICARVCPTSAWRMGDVGFAVTVGGKMGKVPALGRLVFPFVREWGQVLAICEGTLDFYVRHGEKGERFSRTLDRVGWETYVDEVGPWANLSPKA